MAQRLRKIVRPLMLRPRVRGVEFFRASSPTSRGIVCSKTRRYPLRTQSKLRELKSDRPCGRESKGAKHPNHRGTRAFLTRSRRWPERDCRPSFSDRPACNRMKGPALRGVRQVKLSETPAVSRRAQKVESGPSWLATLSATKTNLASVGSGDCSGRDEARQRTLLL
jgi:hypothetical protein